MKKRMPEFGGLPWRFTDKRFTAWGGLRVLEEMLRRIGWQEALAATPLPQPGSNRGCCQSFLPAKDRKSTRLNSSHSQISYALFCLKKKTFCSTLSPLV